MMGFGAIPSEFVAIYGVKEKYGVVMNDLEAVVLLLSIRGKGQG
jgi:hypothetical protein